MTIKAYTFDGIQDGGGQIEAYSSKIDARVRRDMFDGWGDLIIPGDRNGWIQKTAKINEAGKLALTIDDSVTFVTGGRLFTVNDTLLLNITQTQNDARTYTASISFDIDTTSATGSFVSFTESPRFGQGLEAWELDQFSVTYSLIVYDEIGAGLRVYPAPQHNGKIAAGATVNLSKNGTTMKGGPIVWRGSMLQDSSGDLYASQAGQVVTISGAVNDASISGQVVQFGKHGKAPYYLSISQGTAVIFTQSWAALGTIQNGDNVGQFDKFDFILSDIKTITGTKPEALAQVFIMANTSGGWVSL